MLQPAAGSSEWQLDSTLHLTAARIHDAVMLEAERGSFGLQVMCLYVDSWSQGAITAVSVLVCCTLSWGSYSQAALLIHCRVDAQTLHSCSVKFCRAHFVDGLYVYDSAAAAACQLVRCVHLIPILMIAITVTAVLQYWYDY